jgi:FdhD protein
MDRSATISRWTINGKTTPDTVRLAVEEPLEIRVQGRSFAVTMRTPGDEKFLAAGFCFTEGVVAHKEDIATLACCDGPQANIVTVTLTPERLAIVADRLNRATVISQTSCGICGREMVADIERRVTPIESRPDLSLEAIKTCLERLDDLQTLRKITRATHGAAIFNDRYQPLHAAEDVGRHNALDKAIGHLLLDGRLGAAQVAALSSRISYELVQKAARARIPILAGISRPTTLAVDLARHLNLTLICLAPDDGLFVF